MKALQFTVEVIGTEEVTRFLLSGPERSRRGMEKGLDEIAGRIFWRSVLHTPVRTGTLRASGRVVTEPLLRRIGFYAVNPRGHHYSSYVDKGTSRMTARDFFAGTLRLIVPESRDIMKRAIDEELNA